MYFKVSILHIFRTNKKKIIKKNYTKLYQNCYFILKYVLKVIHSTPKFNQF